MQINYEFYIAFASIIVSILAFIISIWSGLETRRYNRLSTTPSLQFRLNTAWDQNVGIKILNLGIGPAIITRVELLFNNEILYPSNSRIKNMPELLEAMNINHPWVIYEIPGTEFYFPAEAEFELLVANNKKIPEEAKKRFLESLSKTTIKIWYKSIYGKKYNLIVSGQNFKLASRNLP